MLGETDTMLRENEYAELDLTAQAELVRRRTVQPSELVEAARARIEKLNPTINAVIRRFDADVDETIASGIPPGPFAGAPFLIKDLALNYAGVPTTAGSPLMIDRPAGADSELMARYRRTGLLTLGKTNTCEFGTLGTTEPRLFGPTRNPWDLAHSSGGSSGGSAAAVASRLVPAAHANDGAGSIRIPASCCGVFGLKPSKGRITHGPDLGEGGVGGIGVEHVVSVSVRDSASLLDATAGGMPGDPYFAPPPPESFFLQMNRLPQRLRIAYADYSMFGTEVDAECVAAVHETARLCEHLGHHVERRSPKFDFASYEEVYRRFWTLTATRTLSLISQRTGISIEQAVSRSEAFNQYLFENGIKVSAAQYLVDLVFFNSFARAMANFHHEFDLWLTPTLGTLPPKLGLFDAGIHGGGTTMDRFVQFLAFTTFANITGQPAMSVPLHWTNEGMPVGSQFAARFGEEGMLLNIARQLEEERPWARKIPAVCQTSLAA